MNYAYKVILFMRTVFIKLKYTSIINLKCVKLQMTRKH